MSVISALLNSVWGQQAVAPHGATGAVAATNTGIRTTASSAPESFLNTSNFFELLTAQLSHQNPLAPMNSTQFMSELAQLSTANGMQSLGQTVAALQSGQSAESRLRAADLIGHYVGVQGNTLALPANGNGAGAYVLPASASQVEITVTNGAGEVVDRMKLGAENSGTHRFSWDGAGQPPGKYQFNVQAVNASGQPLPAQSLALAKISSVQFSASGGINLAFADRSGTLPFGQVIIIF